MANQFTPYNMFQQNPYMQQYQRPYQAPQGYSGQIIQVNGKAGAEALQAQVSKLQLEQATANVLRYPNSWTYAAGVFPPAATP